MFQGPSQFTSTIFRWTQDKLFWIFSSGNDDKKNKYKKLMIILLFYIKKRFEIKTSQKNSLIKIFQKKKFHLEFTISKFDEEPLENFCYSILETIIVGKLAKKILSINQQ